MQASSQAGKQSNKRLIDRASIIVYVHTHMLISVWFFSSVPSTMSRFSAFLALGTVALTLVGIQGQAAINQQHDFFHLDNDQQILNIAQYLAADDVLTKKVTWRPMMC